MFSGPASGLWTSPNPWANVPAGSLKTADNVVFTAPGVIEPRRGFEEGAAFGTSGSLADAFAWYGEQALLAYDFTQVSLYANGAFTDFLQPFAPAGNNRMRFELAARSAFFNPAEGIQVYDGGAPSLANAAVEIGISFAFDGGSGTLGSPFAVTNTTSGGTLTAVAGVTGATGSIYAKSSTVVGSFTNNNALTGSGGWAADVNGGPVMTLLGVAADLAGWGVGQFVTGRTSGARGVISANTVAGTFRGLTFSSVTGTFVNETVDLSNEILRQPTDAGCPQGLNITAEMNSSDGWMPGDSAVAYRFTVCRKDAFGRVIEGPPSGRLVVRNLIQSIYPTDGVTRASNVVHVTTDYPHGLQVGDVVDLTPGEANFAAGLKTVSYVSPANLIQFDYNEVGADASATVTQTWNITRSVDVTLWTGSDVANSGISSVNFLRVYRSEPTEDGGFGTPGDELFQCYETGFLTPAELAQGYVTFQDVAPDSVIDVPMYTNSNTGDGTLAANFQPPVAEDIVYWQDAMWFLNTTSKHSAQVTLIGVGSPDGLQVGDTITIGPDTAAEQTYTAAAAAAGTDFLLTDYSDPAYNIQLTAQSLVQAINTNPANDQFFAFYISSESGQPGKILITARIFGSEQSFKVYSSRSTAWTPTLPTFTTPAFAALASDDNRHAARLWKSKLGQPEAVPILSYIQINADDAPGLRVVPLNYRNIVFKTDGVYAVPNTLPLTYEKLSDAVLLAPDSVQRLGDALWFLSDSGLMVVDDSGVRGVGDPIDLTLNDLNEPSALANVQQRTVGIAYRSDEEYILSLPLRYDGTADLGPGDIITDDNAVDLVFCKKGGPQAFARWLFGIRCGAVDPTTNKLYLCPVGDNRLWIERKTLTNADFYDVGDSAIPCRATFNPFTAGEPAVTKMAQQASFLFRENTAEDLTAEFASELHPTAVEVPLAAVGWGDAPWGQTPWGGSVNPLVRVQPLPGEVANACQLTVGFSANVQGTKFVFLGIDIDANGDTRQSRDS